MVIEEKYGSFVKHWSDNNKMIKKVGTEEVYSEAIDLQTSGFTYEETDIDIEGVE